MTDNGFMKSDKDPVTGETITSPVDDISEVPAETRKNLMEAKAKLDEEQRKKAIEQAKTIKQNIGPKRSFSDLSKEEQELYTKEINSLADKLKGYDEGKMPDNIPSHDHLADMVTESSVPQPKLCPCCGWDVAKDPVEVSDEDKANWLRSIMGAGEFRKTFVMYGGRLKVTFRSRTMDDNNLVNSQLIVDAKLGQFISDVPMISAGLHQGRARRLSLACSFVNLSSSKFQAPRISTEEAKKVYGDHISDKANVVGAAHEVLFGTWPETLYSAVLNQYLKFESICHRLMEASTSADFWAGVESST